MRNGVLLGILTQGALAFALGQHFDPLTGLPRADLLRHHLESLLAQGKDPTLLFVDLDDFGRLNKENGHPFGDRVLKALGRRLKAFAQDLGGEAYRYGGDEFALVFPRPRQVLLPALPELLQPLEVEGERVSFSVGVAGGRRRQGRVPANPSATADDLLKLASLASTHAKRQGLGWAPAEALKAEEEAPEGASSPKEPQSAWGGNHRATRGQEVGVVGGKEVARLAHRVDEEGVFHVRKVHDLAVAGPVAHGEGFGVKGPHVHRVAVAAKGHLPVGEAL